MRLLLLGLISLGIWVVPLHFLPMLGAPIYDMLGLAYVVAATLTHAAWEYIYRPELRSR